MRSYSWYTMGPDIQQKAAWKCIFGVVAGVLLLQSWEHLFKVLEMFVFGLSCHQDVVYPWETQQDGISGRLRVLRRLQKAVGCSGTAPSLCWSSHTASILPPGERVGIHVPDLVWRRSYLPQVMQVGCQSKVGGRCSSLLLNSLSTSNLSKSEWICFSWPQGQ